MLTLIKSKTQIIIFIQSNKQFENTLKFLLLNENEIFGNYIKTLISNHCDECIEVKDFANLNFYYKNSSPDITLIDINLKNVNAFVLASNLKKKYPKAKIALLADYEDKTLQKKSDQIGVDAFIPKENIFEIYNRLKVIS